MIKGTMRALALTGVLLGCSPGLLAQGGAAFIKNPSFESNLNTTTDPLAPGQPMGWPYYSQIDDWTSGGGGVPKGGGRGAPAITHNSSSARPTTASITSIGQNCGRRSQIRRRGFMSATPSRRQTNLSYAFCALRSAHRWLRSGGR